MTKEFNHSPKESRSSGASPPEDKEPEDASPTSGSEFNLSSCIYKIYGVKVCQVEHFKEFIKKDGEIIDDFIRGKIDEAELIARRIKLAGAELI